MDFSQQNYGYASGAAHPVIKVDEIISRSKVGAAFNKSSAEIKNVQSTELQMINDIITIENENLKQLNRRCTKYNLRSEQKFQTGLETQNSLIEKMVEVTDCFRKLNTAIEELDADKTATEQKNKENDYLWNLVNYTNHKEIPGLQSKIHKLQGDINALQSTINCGSKELEILESQQNKISQEISEANQKFRELDNTTEYEQEQLRLEIDNNSNLIQKRDELLNNIEIKTQNLVEMQQNFADTYNENMAKLKIELELELENENLNYINTAKRIADERSSEELRIKQLQEQWDYKENQMLFENKDIQNKIAELRKAIELQDIEKNQEQKLLIDKIKHIDILKKHNSQISKMIEQKEVEYNELDQVHKEEFSKIEKIENQEIRKLQTKNKRISNNVEALRSESKKVTIISATPTPPSPKLVGPQNRKLFGDVSAIRKSYASVMDETSFLSNFSIASGTSLNSSKNQFKLPSNFFDPMSIKRLKLARRPKPKTDASENFSFSDSSDSP